MASIFAVTSTASVCVTGFWALATAAVATTTRERGEVVSS
jgi:hypothetical protein